MKNLRLLLAAASATLWAAGASALPVAQLDIVGTDVTYDPATQTVITSDPVFTLYGYGNTPNGRGKTLDTSLDWYLSVAITPQQTGPADFGSFSVDGTSYDMNDMMFGTPPLDEYASNSSTLPSHGIYDTLYTLIGVTWDPNQTRSAVDVQTTQGTDPLANPGNALMYVGWLINASGLASGYNLHFDLFGVTAGCSPTNITNCNVVEFAPFSHDAGTDVPEPTTLTLLGAGLLMIGFASRRRRRSVNAA